MNCRQGGKRRAFVLNAVPKSGKAHQVAIFSFDIMRQFILWPLLEPFEKALRDDNAALFVLHGRPHTAWAAQRIVAAVDGPHEALVVGVSLGPEGHETPSHGLQPVPHLLVNRTGALWLVLLLRGGGSILCIVFAVVGVGARAGAPVRSIGSIDDTMVSRGEVVGLTWCICSVVVYGVVHGHVVVLQHLPDLRGTLEIGIVSRL